MRKTNIIIGVLSLIVAVISALALFVPKDISATSHIPAGCEGGPPGPIAPGTACPTGKDQHGNPTPKPSGDICGRGDKATTLGVNIGCRGDEGDIDNPIFDMIGAIVRFLAVGVGIVIVLMIVISGIQYITSSGNPDATKAARQRLMNAVIALLLFIFMGAILNFLVPGGILF